MMICGRSLLFVVIIACAILRTSATKSAVSVFFNETSQTFNIGAGALLPLAATVTVDFQMDALGWDIVEGDGNASYTGGGSEWVAYHGVGLGEGFLTQHRIWQNYQNTYIGPDGFGSAVETPGVAHWIDDHMSYLLKRSTKLDIVGKQLKNLMSMLRGLYEGYSLAVTSNGVPNETLNFTQIFWLSFQDEAGDLVTALSPESTSALYRALPNVDPRRRNPRHCSALVKILPDDIYFSHVSWSTFNSMLRMYKTYRFGETFVTMSGYPGVIHSIDDWYMTSHKLAAMETTNIVQNNTLFTEFVRNNAKSISEFLRVMIANFLAADSATWVELFSTENSGTYNNQWMVLDMKKFVPGSPLPPGSFYVAEQLPGPQVYPYGVTSADLSSHLNTYGYWASYNIPFFGNVYNISGNYDAFVADGSFYSHSNYSRAEIFRRNHTFITDVASMQAMMRYNEWETDPFSIISNCKGAGGPTVNKCNPNRSAMLSISSRGDLNPVGDAFQYGPNYHFLTRRNHVGTDSKIALWSSMMADKNATAPATSFVAFIINGPTTYNNQPVFRWSSSPFAQTPGISRLGLPDVYDFPFVRVPLLTLPSSSGLSKREKDLAIGLGSAGLFFMLVIVVVLVKRAKSRDGASESLLN